VRGAYNMATEIGHIPYKKAPFSCGCGRNNCIELFASGSGLKKWTQHYKLECDHSLKSLKKCTNKDIVKSFEEALVHASGVVTTLFNPEVLVLGGGIITANPYLKDIILQTISDHALPQALDGLKICTSTIEDAPIKGALLLKDYDD
jgi:glucokinase